MPDTVNVKTLNGQTVKIEVDLGGVFGSGDTLTVLREKI